MSASTKQKILTTSHLSAKDLLDSYHFCQLAAKESNFYNGIVLTPKNKREAFFSIYAWMRAIDDITDNEKMSDTEKLNQLTKFKEITNKVLHEKSNNYISSLREPFWLALKDTIDHYDISPSCFDDMIAGQQQDLIKRDYKNFDELYDYCYKVASTVGIICVQIWGYDGGEKSLQLAEWCGIAFQLTNISRDIIEDAKHHHVYLPADLVGKAELNGDEIQTIPKENLLTGINVLIDKAEDYYEKSITLYQNIHPDGKLSFLVMVYYYRALFEKIKKNPELALSEKKVRLNKAEKIMLIMTAFINHKLFHHG